MAMITTSEPKPQTATLIGRAIDALDSPQLLIDLDVVDANLERMFAPFRGKPVGVRVHFKSLKCGGLAKYIAERGANGFLCAKLNEAEVLAGVYRDEIRTPLEVDRSLRCGCKHQRTDNSEGDRVLTLLNCHFFPLSSNCTIRQALRA